MTRVEVVVADLREWIEHWREAALEDSVQIGTADQVIATMTEAADRLTELDAARPPCPTCGGTMIAPPELAPDGTQHLIPCPDCVDGKASMQWMAAVFNRIVADQAKYSYPRAILRTVR